MKLYYQSTSKKFVEFRHDNNRTNTHGQAMYELWASNGMCPPTLMAEATWVTAFGMRSAQPAPQGTFRMEFLSRPGLDYTVEYKDAPTEATWRKFTANGNFTATNAFSAFEDDFTTKSSGGPSTIRARYYRFKHSAPWP